MSPEAHGYGNNLQSQERVSDDSYDNSSEIAEQSPKEETFSNEVEALPEEERFESISKEAAKEERLGDLDERLRLLDIERNSASRDFENWKSSPNTNPADFQYRVPHMTNRISAVEQAISSAMIDRELVLANAETPEAADEVVRGFIRQQLLEGKTKSQKNNLKTINDEESALNQSLAEHEKTIESFQAILDGKIPEEKLSEYEQSEKYRRNIADKIHRVSDKYEMVLVDKMSRDFEGQRKKIEDEMKEIEEIGVSDEELPLSVQDDPDFEACLREASFSASADSEAYKIRTKHDPEKEALLIFSKRFPHKVGYYERLNAVSSSEKNENELVAEDGLQGMDSNLEAEPVPINEEESDVEVGSELKSVEVEKIPIKIEQSSRELLRYLIGLEAEDPQVYDRLVEDKAVIRAKYDLPPIEMRAENPAEYERVIRERMNNEGIEYKEAWEVGGFFEHNSSAAGVFLERDNVIAGNVERDNLNEYYSSLGVIEHELIHGLQKKYSERMPIELKEYEAYVGSNFNVDKLKDSDDPEGDLSAMFGFLGIKGSVDWWYKNESERRGETVVPEWDSSWKEKQEKINKKRESLRDSSSKVTVDENKLQEEVTYSYKTRDLKERYTEFFSQKNREGGKLTAFDLSEFDTYLKKISPLLADDFMELLIESKAFSE